MRFLNLRSLIIAKEDGCTTVIWFGLKLFSYFKKRIK